MKPKNIFILLITLLVGGILVWQFLPKKQITGSKLQISTSFYPLYFFTSEIVGNLGEVVNLTPAGTEPHDYDLTPQDLVKIYQSKLLIINSTFFEKWSTKIIDSLKNKPVQILVIADELKKELSDNNTTSSDPHTWLSPILAEKEVDIILQKIIAVDQNNETDYVARANDLKVKLQMLDKDYRSGLSKCSKKDIITSHAAFGYLAKEYGFNQTAIAGLSPDEEPTLQTLKNISDFAQKNNVQYIFFESLVSPKLSETIANEVGAKTLVLNPLEGLSMQDIAKGKNYFTEMRSNLNQLKIALQCQ
jgi:zinc transport system substrate-binding protein